MIAWAALAAIGYLCGSIPFGLLLARAHGIDIRAHGSGNIGATNVMRVLGKELGLRGRRVGLLCLVLDVAKGLVPTLGAGLAMGVAGQARPATDDLIWWLIVMASPVIGHMFSPWLGWRGGKGVATGLGSLLGVFPLLTIPAGGALLVWIASILIWRYVSLSSCLAAASLPAWLWLLARLPDADERSGSLVPAFVATLALACLVVLRHRGNLGRIMRGSEPRILAAHRSDSSSANSNAD